MGARTETWLERPELLAKHHGVCRDAHSASIQEASTYLALWVNRPASAQRSSQGGSVIGFDGLRDLGFNELANVLRGALSKVCVPLQPRIAPIGGTWETLQACRGLSQVADGFFTYHDFARLARRIMAHAALSPLGGVGLVEVDPIKKDFSVSVLDPLSTFFSADHTEVVTLRALSRRRALAVFAGASDESKLAIRSAPRFEPDRLVEVDTYGQWAAEDRVGIVYGWAETIGDDIGKYAIQLLGTGEAVVIDSGDWPYPLPVIHAEWSIGFRGENDSRPLGRTVAPIHFWLNECVRKVDDALAGSIPMITGPLSAKPISDIPFQWIDSTDGPVTITTPRTVSGDVREWIAVLERQSAGATGVSEGTQAGVPPVGLKSGVALSTWRTIDNASLSEQHQAHSDLYTQALRAFVAMATEVYKSRKARRLARDTRVLDQIDFTKISLPEDAYSIAFDVVSDLPRHIPQKLELLAFLNEKDPENFDIGQVFQHLDIVDFRAAADMLNGPRSLIMKQIDRALNEGVLIPPDETQDHAKLAKLAGQALSAARASHLPPPASHLQACLHLYLLAKSWLERSVPVAPEPVATPPSLGGGITEAIPSDGVAPSAAPLPAPVGPVS